MSIEVLGPVTVDDAVQVVDGLASQVGDLSGGDASLQLTRLGVLAAKLDAYRVALVATIDASQVWRETDPNATPASFLRSEHVLDHRQAKADLVAATSFHRFPELEQACREGRISREKVDLILSIGLRKPERARVLGEFLAIFIDLAEQVTTSELKKALELWADQIDPVTTATDEADAHHRRELHVHQLGDGVKLDGFFGHEQGMKIMVALNGALDLHRREHPEAKNDAKTALHATEHGNYRITHATAAQRADAFIDAIITPAIESGALPSCGGAPATVCVIVPLDRLQHPDAPLDHATITTSLTNATLRHNSASIRASNGPGEMLISGTSAQRLSCDASIQRVVLSPAGKPLDIGRRTRLIPEHIRTALIIRDGQCAFPYCDKPTGWSEGHHIIHWSQGGPTSLDNLLLLCSKHHHKIHSDHIPIQLDPAGIPRIKLEHRYRC